MLMGQQVGERLVVRGDVCVLLRQDPHLRAELLLLRLPGGRVLLQVGGLFLVLRGEVGHQLREIVERADREVEHLIARFHPILWPYATACCSRRSRVWYAFKVRRPSRSR